MFVAVSMREHPNNRNGDLPKSWCRLRGPLHLGDGRLGVIHFVVNNTEELWDYQWSWSSIHGIDDDKHSSS